MDIRWGLGGAAGSLEKHRRTPAESFLQHALVIGAHRNDPLGGRENLPRERAPLVRAHIEALGEQIVPDIRADHVREIVGARRCDDEVALRAELAAQGVLRRQAAEDVAGTHEKDHWGLMPESRTMRSAASVSARTKRANSAGVIDIGSAPMRARRSRTSAVATLCARSRAICSTIAGGVPAGAQTPFQKVNS